MNANRAQTFREIRRRLLGAGFSMRFAKGNHVVFNHPTGVRLVMSANDDRGAARDRTRSVNRALLAVTGYHNFAS